MARPKNGWVCLPLSHPANVNATQGKTPDGADAGVNLWKWAAIGLAGYFVFKGMK
jgi:hypothetical protein